VFRTVNLLPWVSALANAFRPARMDPIEALRHE